MDLDHKDKSKSTKKGERQKRVALLPPGAKTRVYITGIDLEGRGRGHIPLEGVDIDVAVRGAYTGDTVTMVVERVFKKRQLLIGRATEVLTEGAMRTEHECPHDAPCLGCPLDGLLYNAALDLKQARIQNALDKYEIDTKIDAFVLPKRTTGVRQKVKLMVGGRAERPLFGLYRPYSQYIVDTTRCIRHHPQINRALAQVREALVDIEPEIFDAIIARVFETGVSVVVVVPEALPNEVWQIFESFVDEGVLASVAEQIKNEGNNIVSGEVARSRGELWLTPLATPDEHDVRETALHFCQPDPVLAAEMYDECAAWLAQEGERFADLYAGSGGFSRYLKAEGAKEVVAVESDARAKEALERSGAKAIIATTQDALEQGAIDGVDGIIADPPRRGLYDDAQAIANIAAKRIALVSCDPNSMARDLRVLLDAGYRIERLTPYELFVGSVAVECVTLLVKDS